MMIFRGKILPALELLAIFFWMSLKNPRVGIFFIFSAPLPSTMPDSIHRFSTIRSMPMSLVALVPKAFSHFPMLSVSHNILIISWWVMDPENRHHWVIINKSPYFSWNDHQLGKSSHPQYTKYPSFSASPNFVGWGIPWGQQLFKHIKNNAELIRPGFPREDIIRKVSFSFGHWRNRGDGRWGVGPCPILLALIQKVHFWLLKGVFQVLNFDVQKRGPSCPNQGQGG